MKGGAEREREREFVIGFGWKTCLVGREMMRAGQRGRVWRGSHDDDDRQADTLRTQFKVSPVVFGCLVSDG